MIETPGTFETHMKDYVARRFDGAEVTDLQTAGALAQGPVWTDMTIKAPRLGTPSGDNLALAATLEPLNLSSRYANETKRTSPIELYSPYERRFDLTYTLDPATRPLAMPEDAALSEPFGRFQRHVTQTGNTVRIEESFELTRSRIPVAEYEAFKGFCNKVDSLLDQKVLLQLK